MADQTFTFDSKQRVALDLMFKIAHNDNDEGKPDPKTYYLTLYRQCLKAAAGNALTDVLDDET